MQRIGRRYPNCGYGGRFIHWMFTDDPQPYNSFGNGSAMRISPVGFAARDPEEAKKLSAAVTAVSHNHPEGMKGAEATAVAIVLASWRNTMTSARPWRNTGTDGRGTGRRSARFPCRRRWPASSKGTAMRMSSETASPSGATATRSPPSPAGSRRRTTACPKNSASRSGLTWIRDC